VKVVCVEPGLIRTRFGDAAVGSIAGDLDVEGPYAGFNQQVAATTAGAYEGGPLAKLGGGPDAVARVIERALTARSPRPRYTVTASAKLALMQRRLVTDRMWDRLMASQFERPSA
jgi:hypothetical protein